MSANKAYQLWETPYRRINYKQLKFLTHGLEHVPVLLVVCKVLLVVGWLENRVRNVHYPHYSLATDTNIIINSKK